MFDTETLEQALGRVRAPKELWDRVRAPEELSRGVNQTRARRISNRGRKLAWSFAAALVFAGVAWNLPRPEFQSNDPAAIRAWAQQHAGIDLPLAHSGTARIESVRLERNGVEIGYRAGGRHASFSVSKGPAGAAHWSANGASYVLACAMPGDLDGACGLCHL